MRACLQPRRARPCPSRMRVTSPGGKRPLGKLTAAARMVLRPDGARAIRTAPASRTNPRMAAYPSASGRTAALMIGREPGHQECDTPDPGDGRQLHERQIAILRVRERAPRGVRCEARLKKFESHPGHWKNQRGGPTGESDCHQAVRDKRQGRSECQAGDDAKIRGTGYREGYPVRRLPESRRASVPRRPCPEARAVVRAACSKNASASHGAIGICIRIPAPRRSAPATSQIIETCVRQHGIMMWLEGCARQ